jgi:hypothetical protein
VRLFPVQVPFARAAAQRTPHVTMTRVPQPKHGGVQLLLQRYLVPSTRHEQRCTVAAVRLREQSNGIWVLVRFQFVWAFRPHAHVFGECGSQPGAYTRILPTSSAAH